MILRGGGAPENKLHKGKFLGFTLNLLSFKKHILPCHSEDKVRRISKKSEQEILHFVQNDRKCAFTLAEVLITLGVIGIVAAMTLPGVLKDVNKNITANKVKKMFSVLQNGVNLAVSEKGDLKDWYDEKAFQEGFDGSYRLYSYYIKPYYNIIQECVSGTNNSAGYKKCGYKENYFYAFDGRVSVEVSASKIPVILNDGAILIFRPLKSDLSSSGSSIWAYYWMAYYDVNGGKGPNKLGVDVFIFYLSPYNNKVSPVGLYNSISDTRFKSEEVIYQQCISLGDACSAKILLDNWKITYY